MQNYQQKEILILQPNMNFFFFFVSPKPNMIDNQLY